VNGTWFALALLTVGGMLVWAGLTGGSLLTALAFGQAPAPAKTTKKPAK
jgi:hypothetical protein